MSALEAFVEEVDAIVHSTDDEHELTARIAPLLSDLLASGYRLLPEFTRPSPARNLTYPLHLAPDGSWSLASVVWAPGQQTPVHSHELWGVAGIYSGAEHEVRFFKPAPGACGPLAYAGEATWRPGQVTVCCTTDDDVHAVTAADGEPTIGIHVYGGDIGATRRRSYDAATGESSWFASGWDDPFSGGGRTGRGS